MAESSSLESPASALDLEAALCGQPDPCFKELGISPEVGHQFFRHVPPRLTTIRLELCTLARLGNPAKRRACLAGLSMQCQWLAGYARMGGFLGLAQCASALESLMKTLYEVPERLNPGVLRTAAQATDLLNILASTAPGKAGRAEGARVLVLDDDNQSQAHALASLEAFGVAAVGVASEDAALGLLTRNPVDVVVLKVGTDLKAAPRICQAIRRLPQHGRTPILVLSSEATWESRAVLAMSGATELAAGRLLAPELALKVLNHFFRVRLSGPTVEAHPISQTNQ